MVFITIMQLALIILTWFYWFKFCKLVFNNIDVIPPMRPDRLISEIEIAAKSIGYWEKRGLEQNPGEISLCIHGLLAAQKRLIELTGDYVPEEAKVELKKPSPSPLAPLPDGVISLELARKSQKGEW